MTQRAGNGDSWHLRSLRLRAMYGCPDLGARIRNLLKERNIKQRTVAEDLGVSPGQVSKLLHDKADLPLGFFLHFMRQLKESPSAFLGEKNALTPELGEALRKLVYAAMPLIQPAGTKTISEETRLIPLLRVAATPNNETYEDDPEPRLYPLPLEYNRPETGAFEVVGDSMSGDAILSGDIVLTRPARNLQECENKIVVCAVHGYRHLKRLRRRHGKVVLQSNAPNRKLWELDESERASFNVIGIVVHQTRRVAR